jgi:hypothetical protein
MILAVIDMGIYYTVNKLPGFLEAQNAILFVKYMYAEARFQIKFEQTKSYMRFFWIFYVERPGYTLYNATYMYIRFVNHAFSIILLSRTCDYTMTNYFTSAFTVVYLDPSR